MLLTEHRQCVAPMYLLTKLWIVKLNIIFPLFSLLVCPSTHEQNSNLFFFCDYYCAFTNSTRCCTLYERAIERTYNFSRKGKYILLINAFVSNHLLSTLLTLINFKGSKWTSNTWIIIQFSLLQYENFYTCDTVLKSNNATRYLITVLIALKHLEIKYCSRDKILI